MSRLPSPNDAMRTMRNGELSLTSLDREASSDQGGGSPTPSGTRGTPYLPPDFPSNSTVYPSPRTMSMQPPAGQSTPFGGQYPNSSDPTALRSNLQKPYVQNEQAYKQNQLNTYLAGQLQTPSTPTPPPAGFNPMGNFNPTGMPSNNNQSPYRMGVTPTAGTAQPANASPGGSPPPVPSPSSTYGGQKPTPAPAWAGTVQGAGTGLPDYGAGKFDRFGTSDTNLDALGKKLGIPRGTSSGLGGGSQTQTNGVYQQMLMQAQRDNPNSDFNKELANDAGYQKVHGDTVTAQQGIARGQLPADAISQRDQAAADAKDPDGAKERQFQSSLANMSPKDAAAAQVAHDKQKAEADNNKGKLAETTRNNIAMTDEKSKKSSFDFLKSLGSGIAGFFEKAIGSSAKATGKTSAATDPEKARNTVEEQWAKTEQDWRDRRDKGFTVGDRDEYDKATDGQLTKMRTAWEQRHPSIYGAPKTPIDPNATSGPTAPGTQGNPESRAPIDVNAVAGPHAPGTQGNPNPEPPAPALVPELKAPQPNAPLPKEMAAKFMAAAGNDRAKAEAMAKAHGWRF